MKSRRFAGIGGMIVLCGVLASASFSSVHADAIFNFDDLTTAAEETPGTQTTFSDTQSGITATFSSPNDPGGFEIYENSQRYGFPAPFAGNVLVNNVYENQLMPLFATFDTPLFGTNLNFVLDEAVGFENATGGFTLQAFSGGINGTLVGTSQAFGTVPEDGEFPQGSISFTSALAFDTLQFNADTAPNFAIDNLSVSTSPEPSPVPEPGTMALMGVGLASLIGARRKRKKDNLV